jgi:hypothetical protein
MHPVTATTAALGLLVTGGAAGAAVAGRPDRAGVAATPSRPAPVEVRTEVIHRTAHVVRHIRPKHRTVAPAAPAAVAAPAPAPPQRAAVTVAPPASAATRPLRTHSSATGASHGDDGEHEGGGDD